MKIGDSVDVTLGDSRVVKGTVVSINPRTLKIRIPYSRVRSRLKKEAPGYYGPDGLVPRVYTREDYTDVGERIISRKRKV